MVTLSQFRENANREGICVDKAHIWDRCTNKKDLMDLALSAQGLDYVANAVSKGWGISPNVIKDKFGSFNNGRYVYNSPTGYRTAMYCGYKGKVLCELTALLIIDSDIELELPSYAICELYVTGKSTITLRGSGRCKVRVYGVSEDIKVTNYGVDYRRIDKNDFER